MAKVTRRLVADGDAYEISCALRSDGTSPAAELLDALDDQMWPDPEAELLPDEYQATTRRRLIAHIEMLAWEGDLPRQAYNRLEDGIWEIKVGNLRLSFFDTDGVGGFEPKLGESGPAWDGSALHLLPEFDDYIRLGHHFPKQSQRTTYEDLQECQNVRLEDVTHDRAE